MAKKYLFIALVCMGLVLTACGQKTETVQQDAPLQEAADETQAQQAEAPAPETTAETIAETASEAPASEGIEAFLGTWGAERWYWIIEKDEEPDRVKITYHGSDSARSGMDGDGGGELEDGRINAYVEYDRYQFGDDAADPASIMVGTFNDIFTLAKDLPDDYVCSVNEKLLVNQTHVEEVGFENMTLDKVSECPNKEYYVLLNSPSFTDTSVTDEYIIWYSGQALLSEDDVMFLDKDQLRLARNEIYARHGMKFNSEDLQNHFNKCSWYIAETDADKFDDSVLSDTEKKNIELIKSFEEK